MQMGIAKYDASFLISLIGISNVIGKICLGYVSDLQGINRFYLYSFCLGMCGLSKGKRGKTNCPQKIMSDLL